MARPWARALFQLALTQENITAWNQFLWSTAIATQKPALRMGLRKPGSRVNDLDEVCAPYSLEGGLTLLKLLAQKGYLFILPSIAEYFSLLILKHKRMIKIKVGSAISLTCEEDTQLKNQLEQVFHCTILLENYVDPQLLGGLLIRAGDQVLDVSLQGRLSSLIAGLTI